MTYEEIEDEMLIACLDPKQLQTCIKRFFNRLVDLDDIQKFTDKYQNEDLFIPVDIDVNLLFDVNSKGLNYMEHNNYRLDYNHMPTVYEMTYSFLRDLYCCNLIEVSHVEITDAFIEMVKGGYPVVEQSKNPSVKQLNLF